MAGNFSFLSFRMGFTNMNIFRLAGDMLHLLAIIVLLVMILKTRSYAGISGKSQLLFVIVYVTRYSDLFTTYINMYITVMKILYILASLSIVLLMVIFRKSYSRKLDTFRIEFLLIPATILALLFNYDFITLEILWTFSIYLEAVAILPQLFFIIKSGEIQPMMAFYLIAMGTYRALYILNWIYRYIEAGHHDFISITAGVVQTVIYCAFLVYYKIRKSIHKKHSIWIIKDLHQQSDHATDKDQQEIVKPELQPFCEKSDKPELRKNGFDNLKDYPLAKIWHEDMKKSSPSNLNFIL
ncbi:ER lumen protein-retaining receptor-like [Phlebotomus papatasi]|uniref:ER lumen protein-retaining receptor-like n=1 Tax=Phlebotomus papatasi TaxID=29031 RepID=UPI0024833C5F|nr:ER lumen protein-retaining receptor-like [Phlebotomus papatasi]